MEMIECHQGSPEWFEARLGIPTASRFKDIMTDPRSKSDRESGALSDTARSYMLELIAERLTGEMQFFSNAATEWGTEHEPGAISAYESRQGVLVESVGLCKHGGVAASPDGFVGYDGGVEVKSPHNPKNHIVTLMNGMPKQHTPQVQGCMWVTGREWWDFISYDPRVPDERFLYIERIWRDEEYIKRLEERVMAFSEQLEKAWATL